MKYRIDELLDLVKCPVICIVDQEQREYETGKGVYSALIKKDTVQGKNLEYEIKGITTEEGKVILSLEKKYSEPIRTDMDADWVKEYKEQNGRYPNLFDGD